MLSNLVMCVVEKLVADEFNIESFPFPKLLKDLQLLRYQPYKKNIKLTKKKKLKTVNI